MLNNSDLTVPGKKYQKKLQKYLVMSKSRRNFAVSKTTRTMAP